MNTDEHIQLFVSVKKYLVPLWVEPANSVNIYGQKVCPTDFIKSVCGHYFRNKTITYHSILSFFSTNFKI